MTDYKFNSEAGVSFCGRKLLITFRFPSGMDGSPYYICRDENTRTGDNEVFPESALSPIPSTPLDADGEEIGVGDLVQPINSVSVGRVAATDLCSGMIAVNPALAAFSEDWAAKFTRILEKAPPKQITLGSRVRDKVSHAKFTVAYGHIHDGRHFWASDSKAAAYNETCLEIIE